MIPPFPLPRCRIPAFPRAIPVIHRSLHTLQDRHWSYSSLPPPARSLLSYDSSLFHFSGSVRGRRTWSPGPIPSGCCKTLVMASKDSPVVLLICQIPSQELAFESSRVCPMRLDFGGGNLK